MWQRHTHTLQQIVVHGRPSATVLSRADSHANAKAAAARRAKRAMWQPPRRAHIYICNGQGRWPPLQAPKSWTGRDWSAARCHRRRPTKNFRRLALVMGKPRLRMSSKSASLYCCFESGGNCATGRGQRWLKLFKQILGFFVPQARRGTP